MNLPLKHKDHLSLQFLYECLAEVKRWLANNFLQLNDNKSKFILFVKKGCVENATDCLGLLPEKNISRVKNVGVIFELKFLLKTNAVLKNFFFHLRSISKLKSILSFKELEKVVLAFTSSRLDYCNALSLGVSQASLSHLQLVQNSAARLLTGTKKRELVLIKLHWLHV